MKTINILLITLLITACSPCKRLVKKCPPIIKDSISYIETIKENPSYTIPDSVYWNLMFECDSNYNVILMELNESNTGIKTETIINTIYKEDKSKSKILLLNIKAKTDSIQTLNRTIEKLKKETKTVTVDKLVPVKYVPKFYKICLLILIVLIVVGIFVIYLRIKNSTLKSLLKGLK